MNFNIMRRLPTFIRNRIEGREQLRKILGNITWLSLDKVLRLFFGLFIGVWVARYLGLEQFGQLNFAQAFVMLFSPLALLGLDSIAIRDIVREPDQRNKTLGTCFVLRLVGSTAAIGVSSGLIIFLRPDDHLMHLLVLIAAGAFLFQVLDVVDFWFQASIQSKYTVYARNVAFLVIAIVKAGLILLNASIEAFAIAALAEIALGSLGLLIFYRWKNHHVRSWSVDMQRAKELLTQSWPLFLAGISIVIYMKIDQVMLGYMMDDTHVGIYSAAVKLVEMTYFVPTTIVASVFPLLIRVKSASTDLYAQRLQMLYDVMGGLSFAFALATTLFSDFIILTLYGDEFAEAGPILSLYAWAGIPVFLGVASSQHLVVDNRIWISLLRTVIGAIVNVFLNFILIPRWGAPGAAAASLVSYTIATISIVFFPGLLDQGRMMIRALNPLRWAYYAARLKST